MIFETISPQLPGPPPPLKITDVECYALLAPDFDPRLHVVGAGQLSRRHPHRRRRLRRRRVRREPVDGEGVHRGSRHPHHGTVDPRPPHRRRSLPDRRAVADVLRRLGHERPPRHGHSRPGRGRDGALGSVRQGRGTPGACPPRWGHARRHHPLCVPPAGRRHLRRVSGRPLRVGREALSTSASAP